MYLTLIKIGKFFWLPNENAVSSKDTFITVHCQILKKSAYTKWTSSPQHHQFTLQGNWTQVGQIGCLSSSRLWTAFNFSRSYFQLTSQVLQDAVVRPDTEQVRNEPHNLKELGIYRTSSRTFVRMRKIWLKDQLRQGQDTAKYRNNVTKLVLRFG